MEISRANEATVKALLDHLVKAFEEFCSEAPEEVPYVDAFMAVHNFHCVIVLDIEKRLKASPARQLLLRQMAIDTFRRAMENKPPFRQEQSDEKQN